MLYCFLSKAAHWLTRSHRSPSPCSFISTEVEVDSLGFAGPSPAGSELGATAEGQCAHSSGRTGSLPLPETRGGGFWPATGVAAGSRCPCAPQCLIQFSLCFPVPQFPHLEPSRSKETWPVSAKTQTLREGPKGDCTLQDSILAKGMPYLSHHLLSRFPRGSHPARG